MKCRKIFQKLRTNVWENVCERERESRNGSDVNLFELFIFFFGFELNEIKRFNANIHTSGVL